MTFSPAAAIIASLLLRLSDLEVEELTGLEISSTRGPAHEEFAQESMSRQPSYQHIVVAVVISRRLILVTYVKP